MCVCGGGGTILLTSSREKCGSMLFMVKEQTSMTRHRAMCHQNLLIAFFFSFPLPLILLAWKTFLTAVCFSYLNHCSGHWHGNVQVHARYSDNDESYRRILADVKTLRHIRHENIQYFLGVCHDLHSDSISIVME